MKSNISIILGILYISFQFSSAFNIDEINSIYYDIDILGTPIRNEKFSDDVLMMVNQLGQQYACSLPPLPSDIKGLGSKDEQAMPEESVDIAELLKPMEAAPCLLTTKGWWTYEFCYGHVIKQFHLEDNKVRASEMLLGKYESEYDWSTGGKGGADASGTSNSNRLQRFHSQYYNNGTKCDLTGEPRKSEVRFKCETDVGDYIERVDEPESCRYIVTVATTRVCHHPYLRPHPSRTPHHINCSPVLDDLKYQQYTMKEKGLEEARKIAAAQEKERRQEARKIASMEQERRLQALKSASSKEHDLHQEAMKITNNLEQQTDQAAKSLQESNLNVADKVTIELINLADSLKKTEKILREPANLKSVVKKAAAAAKRDGADDDPAAGEAGSPTSEGEEGEGRVGVGSVFEVPLTAEDLQDLNAEQQQGQLNTAKVVDPDEEEEDVKQKTASEKRVMTPLERVFDQLKKQQQAHQQPAGGDELESSLLGLRDLMSEDTVELQQLLDETLADLERELEVLGRLSVRRGEHAKAGLWRALADKVNNMKDKMQKEEDGDQDSADWLEKQLSRNDRVMLKAKATLNSMDDMRKLLDGSKAGRTTAAGGAGIVPADGGAVAGAEDGHAPPAEDRVEDYLSLFSGQFVDEVLKQYVSDEDAGSKEGETNSNNKKTSKSAASGSKEDNSVAMSSLQESIKNKLKQSGLDVNKHKIEVKILSPSSLLDYTGEDGEDALSAEQAHSVETLVVKLMGSQKDEIVEKEKHSSLTANYNFYFDDLDDDDDEEEGEVPESGDLASSPEEEKEEEKRQEEVEEHEETSVDDTRQVSDDGDSADGGAAAAAGEAGDNQQPEGDE